MAKKAKTAKKAASSSKKTSSNSSQQTNANSNSKTAYDFSEFSKQFASPSQFWNMASLPSFQPSNMQQVFEQMVETSHKNLEAMTACTQLAVERTQALIEDQAEFNQRFFNEAAASFQEALNNQNIDPREKMEELAEYAKEYLEQAASQTRRATEENIEIAQQISEMINQRINESVEEIRSAA